MFWTTRKRTSDEQKKTIKDLESNINSMGKTLLEASNEIVKNRTKIAEMFSTISAKGDEITRLSKVLDTRAESIKVLEKALRDAQSDIANIGERRDRALRERDEALQRVQTIEEAFNEFKERIALNHGN